MQKIFLFLAMLSLCVTARAQVTAAYDVESSIGSYEEISGGQAISTETTSTVEIGFDFMFDNQYMNRLLVRKGYIKLYKDVETPEDASDDYYVFGSSDNNDLIGMVLSSNFGLLNDTEVSYKVTGSAPSRTLIVQYKNLGANTDRWSEAYIPVQLQIRLHETSGKIEMVFNDWNPADSDISNLATRMGIKGTDPDVLMLTNSFSDISTSTNSSETIYWSKSSYPADGQTYTFTPPEECQAPAAQPTGLTLTANSTQVSGSFTKSASADHYLVLYSGSSTLSGIPTDGTTYSEGDVIGNAKVVTFTTGETFTTTDNLSGATHYSIFVFAVNSECMFGPKYLTTAPLTADITTSPDGSESLTVTGTDLTGVTLAATANAAGDNIIVAMTYDPKLNVYTGKIDDGGTFGTPSGNLSVGDEIEGGGKVIYIGPAKEGIQVTGLEENTPCHFSAWSIDATGTTYSSTYSTADTSTGGSVPYTPPFDKMCPFSAPPGWDATSEFSLANDTNNETVLQARMSSANPTDGTVNEITSPWIELADGTNRVLMDINLTEFVMRQTIAYNEWADGDQFLIQLSTDGDQFTTIHEITKENAPALSTSSSYASLFIPFSIYSGQKVKLRIFWKTYRTNIPVSLKIKNLTVEEVSDCDYPVDLTVDPGSVISDKATLSWKSQGSESAWEMRWRVAGNEEWNETFTVSTNPYTVSGLPSTSDIELQVRAACDETSRSEWSRSATLRSGYSVPFTENLSFSSLPDGWELKTGQLATPTTFDGNSNYWKWYSGMMKGLIFMGSGTTDYKEWVITPPFDMGDGSVNYVLTFKLKQLAQGTASDDTYNIVVSKDGTTFNADDVVASFTGSDIQNGTAEFSATLRGYSGTVRAALYITASDKPATFQMTEVSVIETCPTDIADITVSDITGTSAKVSWSTQSTSSLVFIRQSGDTDKPYVETELTEMQFSDLTPRTDYEIGITKKCADDDIARVTIVKFTTLAEESCPQVEDVTAEPGKYEATIKWNADAMSYNVRYRKTSETEWSVAESLETEVTLTGLDENTEYVYGIQAKCSILDDDVSEYTGDATFRTLAETCFPPTDVTVSPSYDSAEVTWDGDNDQYEIQYAASNDDEWVTVYVTGLTYRIEHLDAETSYKVRIRSICSTTDTSLWTSETTFTTIPLPKCVTPTNLQVSELTSSSALLSWTADESNLRWNLHYRKGADSAWNNVEGITETSYELTGLDEDTPYIWSVMAECEAQNSAYASQNKFSTAVAGISGTGIDITGITVFIKNNILNIVNPDHGYINSVTLYTAGGMLINKYTVETTDNVFIPLGGISGQSVLIAITGNGTSKTVKASIL